MFDVHICGKNQVALAAAQTAYTVQSDPRGEHDVYVGVSERDIYVAPSLQSLSQVVPSLFSRAELDIHHLLFLLRNSFIPLPYTTSKNIFQLSAGEVLALEWRENALRYKNHVDFPYMQHKSAADSVPSAQTLLELITAAMMRAMDDYSRAVLMMSSGKDSSALALAIAEAGLQNRVLCVSYAGEGDDEWEYAAKLCTRLGLRHEVATLNQYSVGQLSQYIDQYFEHASQPSCDLTLIPYLLCLNDRVDAETAVLDGSGNDLVFGHVPQKKDIWSARCSLGRFRLGQLLAGLMPMHSRWQYYLLDPVEWHFAGPRFNGRFLEYVYPEAAVGMTAFWRRYRSRHHGLNRYDARALIRGRLYDVGSIKRKIVAACESVGTEPRLPFTDEGVCQYFFNLPEEYRINTRTSTNKILLRQMLKEYIEYDAETIGKRIFQFDMVPFVEKCAKKISAEIANCELFSNYRYKKIKDNVRHKRTNKRAAYLALTMFQLGGWLNHAEILRRS